jgi:hypothetical protein
MSTKFTDPEKLAPEATTRVDVVSELVFIFVDARFAYDELDEPCEPLFGRLVKYCDTLDIWDNGTE